MSDDGPLQRLANAADDMRLERFLDLTDAARRSDVGEEELIAMSEDDKPDDPDAHKDYFRKTDDTLLVELWYPRNEGERRFVQVGMCGVRAADNIQIEYDFDRDGWVVRQQGGVERPDFIEHAENEPWVEVAFVQAWGLIRDE